MILENHWTGFLTNNGAREFDKILDYNDVGELDRIRHYNVRECNVREGIGFLITVMLEIADYDDVR